MARVRIEPRRALWWICTCGVVVMGRVACLAAARALRVRDAKNVMLCYVKLSVALHRAVAMEIGLALGLSVATDPRA